jgi:aminotransferase
MSASDTSRTRLSHCVQNLPPSGIRRFFDLVIGTPGVISLGVGEPDFVTPWRIRESAIFSLEKGRTSYTSNSGLLELREAIAGYLGEAWQLEYDPKSEILITVGASEAIDLVLRALLDPGDEVIIIEPSYVSYGPLVALAGGAPVYVSASAENAFKPRVEDLEAAVTDRTKLVFLNYPNNPTGAALDRETAARICAFVRDRDLLLLTDEIYAELTYDGTHHTLAGFPGMRDRTVLVHGFSKAFAMTGWRLGYIAAPPDILLGALKIHQYCALCAPIMAQMAALEALGGGIGEMSAMKTHYNRRRRYVTDRLNELGLSVTLPNGAFYVFPSIRSTGLSSTDFATELLQAEKVAVVPGTAFGPTGEGYIRCSYASSMEHLKEALDRIGSFVESRK